MSNETKQALRLRAIACKGFRYVPGMRYLFELATGVWTWARVIDGEYGGGLWDGCVVDLDDAATLGGLLALVRAAWGDAVEIEVTSLANGEGFIVIREDDVDVWEGLGFDSLAAALVAALEAAP